MSASRAFLSTSRLMRVPTRGKALANWARPSIDEMGVPTGSWAQVRDDYSIFLHVKYILFISGTCQVSD